MKAPFIFFLFITIGISQTAKTQELSVYPGFLTMKYYQDTDEISKQEFIQILSQNKEAEQLWKKSNKHIGIAWASLGAQLGFLWWQVDRRENGQSQTAPVVGGLVSLGAVVGFSISSMNLKRKSVLTYNEQLESSTSLHVGPTRNGIGLVISF